MAKDKSKTQGIGWGPLKILINRLIKRIELLERRLGWYISTGGGGTPTPPAETVITGTYDEIKALKDNSELIIGAKYVITDYQTKYTIQNSDSGGILETDTVESFVSGYIVFTAGYQATLTAGREVEITYLPPGYAGSLVLGEKTTVSENFSDYYFRFANNMHTDEANNRLVGVSWALPRYNDLPQDSIINDSNGKPVLRPGGVINTEVHDGTPYMDQTAEENIAPPVEMIVLTAANSSSFEPEGKSGTFAGDVILYDIDDTETKDANGTPNGTRKGLVTYRRNFPTTVDLPLDWRATRYRRYLPDLESRIKLSNNHDDNQLVIPAEQMEAGKKYEIVDLGDTDWYAAGASRVIDHSEIDDVEVQEDLEVTIVDPGTTDFTLYGAPDSRAGTTFVKNSEKGSVGNGTVETYKDIRGVTEVLIAGADPINCTIVQVNDTDFTLLGAADNNVGTTFVSNGVEAIGEGRIDIMLNVGKSFYFNGTPVVGTTGTVRVRTAIRNNNGVNLATTDAQGRDPVTDIDAYYLAINVEWKFLSSNSLGLPKFFTPTLEGYDRAKDYTVIPIDSNYNFVETDEGDFIKIRGTVDNTIWINDVLTVQGHELKLDIDGGSFINSTFCGLATASAGSGGIYVEGVIFFDEMKSYSTMMGVTIIDTTFLGITYFNFCQSVEIRNCLFAIMDATSQLPGQNFGYAWSNWNHLNGVRFYNSTISSRAAKTVIADSGIYNCFLTVPNTSTNTTEDALFTSRDAFRMIGTTLTNMQMRMIALNAFSSMSDVNTKEWGLYRWDRMTEILNTSIMSSLRLSLNLNNNQIINKVIDADNQQTYETWRTGLKAQDSWS